MATRGHLVLGYVGWAAVAMLCGCHSVERSGPVAQQPATRNADPSPEAVAVATELLRIGLAPHIEQLLAKPQVHITAVPEPVDYLDTWGSDDETVTFYFGDHAFDMPIDLLGSMPSPRLFMRSPRAELPGEWHFHAIAWSDVMAPHWSDFGSEGSFADFLGDTDSELIRRFGEDLASRFHFKDDHAIYRRLYSLSFEDVRLDRLSGNDLLELWVLLQLKYSCGLSGSEDRVAFGRTPHFDAMTNGTLDGYTGIYIILSRGPAEAAFHIMRSRKAEKPYQPIDERLVERMVASVRRHDSVTPGADMQRAAEALSQPPTTAQKERIARYLLAIALQYADGHDETIRRLEASLTDDMEHLDGFRDALHRARTGLCLNCGNGPGEHDEFHRFFGPTTPGSSPDGAVSDPIDDGE